MNKDEIKNLANEILLTLTPEEEAAFAGEFAYFKELAKLLEALPGIDEKEPLIFPVEITQDYLRPDTPEETPGAKRILQNSKNAKDDFVVLPKVVK